MNETLNFTLLGIIAISMFVEHILLLSWNYGYFTNGIVIYQKRIFLTHNAYLKPAIDHAQMTITPNFMHGSIECNEIKPNVFLFRNKMYELRFYGLNRGIGTRRVLHYDPATGALEVRGFLSWFYIPIWGLVAYFMASFLIANFSFITLIVEVFVSIIIFIVSLYPASIDIKINDEVIYFLKVYFRNQLTSSR